MATIDDARREALLREVAEIAMADQAIYSVHQDNIFATRRGLQYAPRTDGYMSAYMIHPAN